MKEMRTVWWREKRKAERRDTLKEMLKVLQKALKMAVLKEMLKVP